QGRHALSTSAAQKSTGHGLEVPGWSQQPIPGAFELEQFQRRRLDDLVEVRLDRVDREGLVAVPGAELAQATLEGSRQQQAVEHAAYDHSFISNRSSEIDFLQ